MGCISCSPVPDRSFGHYYSVVILSVELLEMAPCLCGSSHMTRVHVWVSSAKGTGSGCHLLAVGNSIGAPGYPKDYIVTSLIE